MSKKQKIAMGQEGIYDAKVLGLPRMLVLGVQHLFAMFGATVLVPLLTGLPVSTTLLMAGLGTLLFHLICGGKVPAFLGSSFAFLGGYAAVKTTLSTLDPNMSEPTQLAYASLGVACAGLVYLILAALFAIFPVEKVMRFFPPVVTGPIIIAIGLNLAGSAVSNCKTNWLLALIALVVVVVFNIWGKGMSKIVPILLGVIVSVAVAVVLALTCGQTISVDGAEYIALAGKENFILFSKANLDNLVNAKWIGLPISSDYWVFTNIKNGSFALTSIIAVVPIAFASMMEHIGDVSAISATTERNFLANPGLKRTLVGDGLATSLSALFGGPANTTYGENTGVLALTKVYDPKVVRIAAVFAIILSFSPKVAAAIYLMPTAVIGGISFILYGMISGIGIRNMVENKVDLKKSRNLIITAIILVCALGLGDGITFSIGKMSITLTALAVASIAGILINAILPGNDYKFKMEEYSNGKPRQEKAQKAAEVQQPVEGK